MESQDDTQLTQSGIKWKTGKNLIKAAEDKTKKEGKKRSLDEMENSSSFFEVLFLLLYLIC